MNNLKHAKLGEKYQLFLSVDGISPVYTDILQRATIIGVMDVSGGSDVLLLGWNKNDKPILDSFLFNLVNYVGSDTYYQNISDGMSHIDSVTEYAYGTYIDRDYEYWSKIDDTKLLPAASKKTSDPLYDFFAAVQPGNCQSCGAPLPCKYHP